jgi:acetyltransferase-like isoleucine patch superfamily enzyme
MHTPGKLGHLVYTLKNNPLELIRLFHIAFTTAYFRYVRRCVGAGTTVEPGTKIINGANVRIGRDCLLKESIYIRTGTEGKIRIADRVAINGFCKIYGHGSIEIGEDTQIGPGVLMTTTSHNYEGELETSYLGIRIGKRVWIGANVTILPGVEIGDQAVIGAGSVVNKSIPPYTVSVGVPARVIKTIKETEKSPAPVSPA